MQNNVQQRGAGFLGASPSGLAAVPAPLVGKDSLEGHVNETIMDPAPFAQEAVEREAQPFWDAAALLVVR